MATLSQRLLRAFVALLFLCGAQPVTAQPAEKTKSNVSIAAVGDEFWDDRFNALGVSGYVHALAVAGDDVYVGGNFSQVARVPARNIARWNSTTATWSALGSGVGGYVYSIAVSGNDVYVGGYFSAAGGVPANNIARWNTTTGTWSALGSGVNSYVHDIEINGGDVYAGGSFRQAGSIPANSIARWNSATGAWSNLGAGILGYVWDITISGNDVFAGGLFWAAGGAPANNIARWNSLTEAWAPLGGGVGPAGVKTIVINGSDVVAGGDFNSAGGIPSIPGTLHIAKWNRNTGIWSALGDGASGSVYDIAIAGNDLYVGGSFNAASNVPNSRNIARWNGSNWSALGSGVSSYVYDVAVGADGIYVGGLFNATGDKAARNFGRWFGVTPAPPPPPPPPPPGFTAMIQGRVSWPGEGNPVAPGVRVQICPASGGRCVWYGVTDGFGAYTSASLPVGDYFVTAFPRASLTPGDCLRPTTVGPVSIGEDSIVDAPEIIFENCRPPIPGFGAAPSRRRGPSGIPILGWRRPTEIYRPGCGGGSATWQFLQGGAIVRSGTMTPSSLGGFRASLGTLYPIIGRAAIRMVALCPSAQAQTETDEFDVVVDPGGRVVTTADAPIEGATLTLYYFDEVAGSFSIVPDGSDLMSSANPLNPDTSDPDGSFGWELADGFYIVRATKAGCAAPFNSGQAFVESDILGPAFEDLDLRLDCGLNNAHLFLPLLQR